MKIKKEEFDEIYNDNITKKRYNEIIEKIDKRFCEIVDFLIEKHDNRGWFDYGNCDFNKDGYFDPDLYRTTIHIGGQHLEIPLPYSYEIPTRWLWEDFKEEMKYGIEYFERKEKEKKLKEKTIKDKTKKKNKELRESIKSKLTKEEFSILKFK
jgi:hypothetical protein